MIRSSHSDAVGSFKISRIPSKPLSSSAGASSSASSSSADTPAASAEKPQEFIPTPEDEVVSDADLTVDAKKELLSKFITSVFEKGTTVDVVILMWILLKLEVEGKKAGKEDFEISIEKLPHTAFFSTSLLFPPESCMFTFSSLFTTS